VTIGVVRDGDDFYVRAVNGRSKGWFRGTEDRYEAHVRAGGIDKDDQLVDTDVLVEEINAAYRAKSNRYPANIIGGVQAPQAQPATHRIVPS
jgi:hypothetical protein